MNGTKMLNVKIIFVSLVFFASANHLPEIFKPYRCVANKDLDSCVLINGNKVIGLLVNGVPELQIPKLDPLEFEFIKLIETPQLHLNLSKIKIHGLSKVQFKKTKGNVEKAVVGAILGAENITINGAYSVNGQISVMPFKGSGPFSLYLKNGVFDSEIRCIIIKDSEVNEYFKRQNITIDYKFDGMVFNFENLFDGNAKLGEEINKFLNENWKQVLAEFGPGITDILIGVIGEMFDKFTTISLNELLLEN